MNTVQKFKPITKAGVVLGQEKAALYLNAVLDEGRIPHAFLFAGLHGVGKEAMALNFAMARFCLEGTGEIPCGHCNSCKRILSGNHPDVMVLKPQGRIIKISQVRDLCQVLNRRSYEGGARVIIIKDSGAMNPEAANCLLKVLEEPPSETMMILTAQEPSDLIPTVASRCHLIRFNPVPHGEIQEYLMKEHDLGENEAGIISKMARGSVSMALSMNDSRWINLRSLVLNGMASASEGGPAICMLLAEKLLKYKGMFYQIFDIMTSYLRDLIVYPLFPERIINKDLEALISNESRNKNPGAFFSTIKTIQKARMSFEANANKRLVLENLFIKYQEAGK